MPTVNVRELARNTRKVIDDAARRHRSTLVTRAGRPVAAVVPINVDALEDWILVSTPGFVDGLRLADEEMRTGKTVALEDLLRRARKKKRRAPARR